MTDLVLTHLDHHWVTAHHAHLHSVMSMRFGRFFFFTFLKCCVFLVYIDWTILKSYPVRKNLPILFLVGASEPPSV